MLRNFLMEHPHTYHKILTENPYNLTIKESDDGLILFKYNQIKSDFSNPIVREARGIIFDKYFNVVCRPFEKFFNYGESHAATINWKSPMLSVTEKIDGSLIKVFYYDKKWRVATNGNINAYIAPLASYSEYKTFGDLFDVALARVGLSFETFTETLDRTCTYMFELVSPYNKVVIPYSEIELYYLTCKDNEFNSYVDDNRVSYRIKRPRIYSINSLDKVISVAKELDWKNEGFVVCDGVHRIKIKSPAWVVAHHARNNGNITIKTLVDIAMMNEGDEFLTYAPEYITSYFKVKSALNGLKNQAICATAIVTYIEKTNKTNLDKKDFALWVINEFKPAPIVKSYLFKWYYNKKLDFDTFIKSTSLNTITDSVELILHEVYK